MQELLVLLPAFLFGLAVLTWWRSRRGRAPTALAVVFHKIVDPAVAHRALVDNADAFSDRPSPRFLVALAETRGGEHNENLNSVPYGPHWRALRRNITAETLHPSRLDHLAPLQRDAVCGLVTALSSSDATSPTAVVEVRNHLYAAVFAVVARLCFGDVGDGDVGAMCRLVQGFQVATGGVEDDLLGSSALGRLVQWRRIRKLLALEGRLSEIFLPLIAARRESRQRDDDGGGGRRPYVYSLVDLRVPDERKDDGGRRGLRDDEMVSLVVEFLGAATGTMATCLEWTLAHLVARPEIQKRLRREVDGASGMDRNQLRSMTYLHSVVLESLRMHPPVPFVLRQVHADPDAERVLGKTTTRPAVPARFVQFAVGDIGRDGKTWTDPDEFRPERFMAGGEGEGVGPLPGPKEMRMMPFGAGHRFCPGMGMAMVSTKCFLAALVREFEWASPASSHGSVDLTELDKFFKFMKTPLCARVTRRCT